MESWKEWIIPLTILVVGKTIDLILPWIRSYLENKYLSYKQRRLSLLIKRYNEIKSFNQNPVFTDKPPMYLRFMVYLVLFMFLITLFPDFLTNQGLLRVIINISFSIFAAYVLIRLSNDLTLIRSFKDFGRYRARVIDKLIKLGGNPEDLDKEGTEQTQGG